MIGAVLRKWRFEASYGVEWQLVGVLQILSRDL